MDWTVNAYNLLIYVPLLCILSTCWFCNNHFEVYGIDSNHFEAAYAYSYPSSISSGLHNFDVYGIDYKAAWRRHIFHVSSTVINPITLFGEPVNFKPFFRIWYWLLLPAKSFLLNIYIYIHIYIYIYLFWLYNYIYLYFGSTLICIECVLFFSHSTVTVFTLTGGAREGPAGAVAPPNFSCHSFH